MATAGVDGEVSKGNAGKLERARKRDYTKWSPEDVWKIDKTGSICRGLPNRSLNEKGQRCMGGKQAKQGNTRAFFCNCWGGKWSGSHRHWKICKATGCFANLKDNKRPYGCCYYASPREKCFSRVVPNGQARSGSWLGPENFCIFLPNQWAASLWVRFVCSNTE